ncbi:MAG: UPF0175 family protein, partial [Bacteroidota bacterium]
RKRFILKRGLFEKEIFSLGQASEFADKPQFIIQQELAKRQIPIHYGYEEFQEDLATVKKMRDQRDNH